MGICLAQFEGDTGGAVKQGRSVISLFPCLAVFGGPKSLDQRYPDAGKNSTKIVSLTPFCVPPMLVKLGLESSVPIC